MKDYKCKECKGTGRMKDNSEPGLLGTFNIQCPKCKGSGKLDWVENIVGPRVPKFLAAEYTITIGIVENEEMKDEKPKENETSSKKD